MKKAIVWAFLFIILVLLTAQAIDSNRTELTRDFAFRLELPFIGTYETAISPSIATYFVFCILLGGFVVMVFSLAVVIRANRQARLARREAEELRDELEQLRGPAEDDEVYQASTNMDRLD